MNNLGLLGCHVSLERLLAKRWHIREAIEPAHHPKEYEWGAYSFMTEHGPVTSNPGRPTEENYRCKTKTEPT